MKIFLKLFFLILICFSNSSFTEQLPHSSKQIGGSIQGDQLSLYNKVTILAGTGNWCYSLFLFDNGNDCKIEIGSLDGKGIAASFYRPAAITTDGTNLYVADAFNHLIRKIVISTGDVTTLAGTGSPGSKDGVGTSASFFYPEGITTDGTSLYVADYYNHNIRKIEILSKKKFPWSIEKSIVTTLAGTSSPGSKDGVGTSASFFYPIVADYYNHNIRKIN